MLLINRVQDARSWPFGEAKKLLLRIEKIGKSEVILETGYGPSGLPHIGTFGEVLRTTFIMNAFKKMSNIPSKIIVFSDDMDGLRKVPSNVPNQELLTKHLDMPLTNVPDPFGEYLSFAHHNNSMLRRFLDSFGFEYEFKSSTEMYKTGVFNDHLFKLLEHFNDVMDIMLPSLREERQKTYSPFLPICKRTGKVLQVPIEEVNIPSKSIVYKDPETGAREEISVLDGNCKLQWKADWGMRWAAFGVDYEMNGKDLIDSFKLSSRICKAIGGLPPENLTYELFLDDDGKKISKSKGNGISMDEWLAYAPSESLAYYMFQSPKRAKRLYFDVIPNAMDDYLESITKFQMEDDDRRLDNPVYHIHNGNPPDYGDVPKFSMILNLVQACSTSDEEILMRFIKKYSSVTTKESLNFMSEMAKFAVRYYNDFIANTRVSVIPTELQMNALKHLVNELEKMDDISSSTDFQNAIFESGKKFYSNEIRDWFVTLYSVLFGAESGPKMGSFISLYGVKNTINLINKKLGKEGS
ncbi:MAG: lysine--tRNA ligase [Holosporales bacterium]|jgi:lysyl-tRNA synthetase class 1|nr:lysine--tRNA ligase [Holosporales bacterium]